MATNGQKMTANEQKRITADKARIEKEILEELEKEIQYDPPNFHGRGKKKAVSPPFEFDHYGHARLFREYTAGHIKFIYDYNKFAVYDKTKGVYTMEFATSSLWCVLERLARARLESLELLDRDEQDAAMAFAKKMLDHRDGGHIIKLLKEKELICYLSEFDSDPLLLNCLGDVYDFRTGGSRPATRDDRFLKTTGIRPEKMETPEFDKFLGWATMSRPEIAAWIMRWYGYSLTGLTTHEIFVNFHGSGRNGKGTLLHLMQNIFGDYQAELPLSAIVLEPHENKKSFDLADAPGRRSLSVSDTPKNARFNAEVVKKMTGNDTMRSEQKYQNSFQFKNVAKLVVCSNDEIRLPSTGPDMKDRVRRIPFDNYIEVENQDHGLPERLFREAPGILYKLIQEAVAYVQTGEFPKCDVIDQATEGYFDKQDTVKMFCDTCIEYCPGEKVQGGVLFAKYKEWCENSGYGWKQNKGFGEDVSKKYDKKRTESGVCYLNIRIKEA